MRKIILSSMLILTASFSSANDAQKEIEGKMIAIKRNSGECYKNIKVSLHGSDLTVLSFMSVILLNSEIEISTEIARLKTENAENCAQFADQVNAYSEANDNRLESISAGIENCLKSKPELQKTVKRITADGANLPKFIKNIKDLDFTQNQTCTELKEQISKIED